MEEKKTGLIAGKYIIRKSDGSPTDPDARFFVLRYDENQDDKKHMEACRKALLTYANEIEDHLPLLAWDLRKLFNIDRWTRVKGEREIYGEKQFDIDESYIKTGEGWKEKLRIVRYPDMEAPLVKVFHHKIVDSGIPMPKEFGETGNSWDTTEMFEETMSYEEAKKVFALLT